ncbi:hypothetical protein pdam_00007574 [Pocillopora damicornis]|uniref:Uncharacterized protein n=1 Tax=Pocillopora damicornis TaxID=46731 RepID=A0A3M6V500_POCDA|nr:hypothetical protein pdam_00007574 [Pocillopora damicornis]
MTTNHLFDKDTALSYSFVEHPEEILEERVLGQVGLKAVVLEECYFESGKCDWTSPHANSKWKLFPGTKSLKHFYNLKYLRKEAQYCEQQLSFFCN